MRLSDLYFLSLLSLSSTHHHLHSEILLPAASTNSCWSVEPFSLFELQSDVVLFSLSSLERPFNICVAEICLGDHDGPDKPFISKVIQSRG